MVLVHDDDVDLGDLGSTLWYPLWDSGRRLDHSVRSMSQVLEAAADLRVALGLLDARHLAGDPGPEPAAAHHDAGRLAPAGPDPAAGARGRSPASATT